MLTELVKNKMKRAYEAADLSFRLTKDLRSRLALLSCYAGIVRDRNNPEEVALELSPDGASFPVRMRKSDIFTLSEIFFGREYSLRTRLPTSPIVFDCGANIGMSTIWFLSQLPGARVHAFEPEPENFRLLSANLSGRDDVVLNAAALGRESGNAALYLGEHSALHSVKNLEGGSRAVEVPAISLSDYMRKKRIDRIDLLKLDVEGSELEVLQGLGSLIDNVGVVIGEVHERVVDAGEFYAYVEARGFRCCMRRRVQPDAHLFELARPPKDLYVIPGAGHNDTYSTGGRPYLDAWRRFLGVSPELGSTLNS